MAVCSTIVLGKHIHMQKNNVVSFLHHIQNLTQSVSDDPNMIDKTIRLSEGNIGEKLYVIEFGSNFLDVTPKAQATKEEIDKLNLIKIKNFIHQRILLTE